jgi:hypothetical protein
MPIDPRIAMGIQPLQLQMPNPGNQMNMLAQALQVKSGMTQMQEAEQARSERNALNEAYKGALGQDGSVDRNMLFRTLADRNLGAKIPGLQKQFAEADKATADVGSTKANTAKTQIEAAHKRVDLAGQSMGWLRQNPTAQNAAQVVEYLVANEVWAPEKAQAILAKIQADPSPQNVAQFADMSFRAALSAKEQLPKFQTNNTGGQTLTQQFDPVSGKLLGSNAVRNTQSPDNAASVAATMRGQNMADARSREATAATMTKPFEVTGEDGKPVLVQQDKQGNLRPVQGYAPKSGGKPMTEGQAKANLFGSRMKESDRILKELEGKYSPMAVNARMAAQKTPGVGGLAGAVGNAMLSEEGQRAEQAQRDFVNAVLRRESGAVISESEFANAQQQYFPQPNDKPGQLEQKRRNRALAIQGLEAEVPGGLKAGAPAGGASGGWSIQKVN